MRYIVTVFIVVLCSSGQVSAQEKDTLIEKIATPDKSRTLPEHADIHGSPGLVSMPFSTYDFESSSAFQNPALPVINFNLINGLKIETGTLMGIGSIYGFPFGNNPIGFYRRSLWDDYQGIYGIRTYQLNNKLYVGTAGYSDKSFNEYSSKFGLYRQTNFNSSLFVGYKFSEKFSISAGFTIQRYGDPLNRNQGIQNSKIFP